MYSVPYINTYLQFRSPLSLLSLLLYMYAHHMLGSNRKSLGWWELFRSLFNRSSFTLCCSILYRPSALLHDAKKILQSTYLDTYTSNQPTTHPATPSHRTDPSTSTSLLHAPTLQSS